MMTKKKEAAAVRAAKTRLGVTWVQLAKAVGRPLAWTTAALLGQHPMTAAEADAAASVLDRLDVTRVPDPAGDRVVVVLDGKFLPYQW